MTTASREASDTEPVAVIFSKMRRNDIPEVLALERASFTIPWSEASLLFASAAAYSHAVVARSSDGELLGFGIMSCLCNEAELQNLAVTGAYRRRGIGGALLGELCRIATEHEAEVMYLEVREGNEAARSLYGKYGFIRYGSRKDYYSQPKESAILMKKELFSADLKGKNA